ncbi:MAG: hypothetical protein ACPH4I_05875, partial [Flavobacteriaceae bacterium]
MMKQIFRFTFILTLLLSISLQAQRSKKKGTVSQATQLESLVNTAKSFNGFFDFFYDESSGKVYLKVNKKNQIDTEFLYINSLSAGIGSNDIGLDRGQLGNERVVYFSKAGNKLLLIQPNLKYRTSTSNVLEKQSVKEAFAESVLF